MLVRLSNSGHYPSKIVEVTDDEYRRLLQIQGSYGELTAARVPEEERVFATAVYERPEAVKIPTLIYYA